MRVVSTVAASPKAGNSFTEIEDDYVVPGRRLRNTPNTFAAHTTRRLIFALSDGATTSSFSREWAHLLVTACWSTRFGPQLNGSWPDLAQLRARWHKHADRENLPWYAQQKLALGTGATFLGLWLFPATAASARWGSWIALAAGDSCLMQVRNDRLIASLPIKSAVDFNAAPALLSTLQLDGPRSRVLQRFRGMWQQGDRIFLLTDAIAAWFLTQTDQNMRPWQELQRMVLHPADWETWLNVLRAEKELRNDDVTVVMIAVGGKQ